MLSASIEDYIKGIYALELEHQKATTKRIAERLGVRMASVSGMIKHLAAEGYVRHTPYYGARLTEKGRRIAVDMVRRHRLIETFLCQTLGLSWDEVDADAEVLEHAVSDRLIERISEYLGRPQFDPHGSPIPGRDGSVPPPVGLPLDQLPEGARGKIVEVYDRDPEFLRYLTSLTLELGTEVRVRQRAPFDGPITIELGSQTIAIGATAARRIRVAVEERQKAKPKSRSRTRRGV